MDDLADLSPVCFDQRLRLLDRLDAEDREEVVGERAAGVFLQRRGRLRPANRPGRGDRPAGGGRMEHAVPGEDGRGGAGHPAAEQTAGAAGAADLPQVAARRAGRAATRTVLLQSREQGEVQVAQIGRPAVGGKRRSAVRAPVMAARRTARGAAAHRSAARAGSLRPRPPGP